jgi:hypothetical protein
MSELNTKMTAIANDIRELNIKMTAIADNIRELSGATETLSLDEMHSTLNNTLTSCNEKFETTNELIDNINTVLNSKVINNSGYDEFWDNFQDFGNRVNYERAFCGFTNETFKPKYDIKPTHVYGLFWGCPATIDLAARLEELGITLDLSNGGSGSGINYIFGSSKFIRIGVVDTRNMSSLPQTFQSCSNLITIDKLILKEDGSQTFQYTFGGCSSLENIVIEGKIGQDVSFNASPKLTHDSLMSIINALYNYSDTTTTKTLTLGTVNLAKLTDVEKAIATEKGWTLT